MGTAGTAAGTVGTAGSDGWQVGFDRWRTVGNSAPGPVLTPAPVYAIAWCEPATSLASRRNSVKFGSRLSSFRLLRSS